MPLTAGLEQRLRKIEAEIRPLRYEVVVVVDPATGGEVYRSKGTGKNAWATGINLKRMIVTHNHPPPGLPFPSVEDVNTAAVNNVLQIRVAGKWGIRAYLSTIERTRLFPDWPTVLVAQQPLHQAVFKVWFAKWGVNEGWRRLILLAGDSYPDRLIYKAGYV